jgi:flagellar hook assembly protein FlgD
MMGQMASFSTLEQITNMAAANQTIASNLTSTGAIGLIGRTVTYTDDNDIPHTGVVEKVTTAGGSPSLTVAGVDGVDPANISQVA